ncbi:high affinity immunoglobulin gamma Fc receptor I-like [Archocentrus centrarchus]|uniref:high affinity immunoglobulin gamma Fc receptor I-like n=1 Tax=Archocentrus centrarchus TaxID=63155 RepID=UPI0011E9C5FC|nr:high affinity immunoglobulin gamma Fc receptor I-like [Archocentrus centrarchus]
MKTPSASLLLGVCVLLLSALTVSAVSLSVSPNLQQFFRGSSSVSLSCVDDDGQTVDGWTVRRTRGGLTEVCGATTGFGGVDGSFCVLNLSVSSDGSYSCMYSSGHQSNEVSISVSEKPVILEIPALPVRTGNDVTLHCRERSGDTAAAFFFFNGHPVESRTTAEHVIRQAKQSDEGLYWCATDTFGMSPQSFLRVRGAAELTYDQVVINDQRKAGRRTGNMKQNLLYR